MLFRLTSGEQFALGIVVFLICLGVLGLAIL